MESHEELPRSDLAQLQREVLSREPEAALPCNLSDYWLALIGRDLETCLSDSEDSSPESTGAAPLALILHLLCGKVGSRELSVPLDDMFKHFQDLRIEIALETMSRVTDIQADRATLATIFTDRQVSVLRTS